MSRIGVTALVIFVAALLLTFGGTLPVTADDDEEKENNARRFRARLTGFQEVPAVSSPGRGTFRAQLNRAESMLDFELTYLGLEGATAAHIHLGQPDVAGGVIVFLCGGGGRPSCPPSAGTVTGVLVAADVIGPASQGIAAGEFDELVTALRGGVTYVNVHTGVFPGGVIRGDIRGTSSRGD